MVNTNHFAASSFANTLFLLLQAKPSIIKSQKILFFEYFKHLAANMELDVNEEPEVHINLLTVKIVINKSTYNLFIQLLSRKQLCEHGVRKTCSKQESIFFVNFISIQFADIYHSLIYFHRAMRGQYTFINNLESYLKRLSNWFWYFQKI